MNAYLSKMNNEWFEDYIYISRQHLIDRGYKVIPFDEDNMENTLCNKHITKDDICVASVEATTKFFELAGVKTPLHIGYPEQLKSYLGRNIELTTFGELDNNFPYFVKPSEQVKLFTGDIVSSKNHLEYLVQFDNCKPDTKIYKSEIVEFLTEYRVFVSNGKVYGMKHYKGDFMKFVDISIIDKMIKDFTDCPSAFTLDIGLTDDGRTLLVEVNDMWAIGSYGLDGRDYSLLCARRMKEILSHV